MKKQWPTLLLGAVLLVGLVLWFWKGEKGRRVRDRMMLRLPLVRDIVQYAVVERLCRILGAMSSAAVPLPDAMTAAMRRRGGADAPDGTGLTSRGTSPVRALPRASRSCSILLIRLIVQRSRQVPPCRQARLRPQAMASGGV